MPLQQTTVYEWFLNAEIEIVSAQCVEIASLNIF